MGNTYTQINIHLIFAVSGRSCLLSGDFRTDLFKYIFGILEKNNQFPLAVNGYSDHVHAFFELNPVSSTSEIARIVKSNSSKWINENRFINGKFNWQRGYGAFSYSRSQRSRVINYIINQEAHHRKKSFRDEYLEMLKRFEISYNREYLFDFMDNVDNP